MAKSTELATTKAPKAKPIRLNSEKYTTGSVQAFNSKGCRFFLNYKDENGKWKTKNKTYRPAKGTKWSMTAAETELINWVAELDRAEAQAIEDAKHQAEQEAKQAQEKAKRAVTVESYMRAFIKEHAHEHEPRTVSEYDRLLRNHIAPILGDVPIQELDPEKVGAWVTALIEEKHYAPRTVRKAFIILRAGMRQAVERDTLAKDPTRTVNPPKVEKKNPNALDATGRRQVLKFIEIDPSGAYNMAYSFALVMGMRAGEICGLTWRHVDLKNRKLTIAQSLGMDSGARGAARWYIKEPKNAQSRRTLTIPAQLIDPLKARLAEAKKAAFANGMKWQNYYVVGAADGSFMNMDMLSHKWHDTAKVLDLKTTTGEPPRFHDLRHTWATKAVEDGKDIKSISAYMGHKDANMTLNIYASADPEANARTAQGVADSMFEEAAAPAGEIVEFSKTGTED